MTLESPGQLGEADTWGTIQTVGILQIEECGRQPLFWKFKKIGLNNGLYILFAKIIKKIHM